MNVISIDGGACYGAMTVTLLHKIMEEQPNLLSKTKLVAGTSVGGIIAAGLAYGLTPIQLKDMFMDWAEKIFNNQSWSRKLKSYLGLSAKHDNKVFKSLLEDSFGDITLGELKYKILIPALELMNNSDIHPHWKAKFFHNFEGSDSDSHEKVVDVLLYTTAAPLFLPTYNGFLDGGFVQNNPAMSAIAITQDERCIIKPRPSLTELRILSFGRNDIRSYIPGKRHDWGYLKWCIPLTTLIYDSDERVIDYQCDKILGHRYHRINPYIHDGVRVRIDRWDNIPELMKYAEQTDIRATLDWLEEEW